MKHVPIRPPRNMSEEQVFVRRWKELMESKQPCESGMIRRILIGYPYEIDQRVASVLASLVCWLGTNVGKGFLDTGNRIKENVPLIRFPYLAAWGECNARIFGMNSGARQIEFLTRTQDDMDRDVFHEVSVKDLEALEQLCMWLGTAEGRSFVEGCEAEVERRKELESLAFYIAEGRQNSPAARRIMDKFAITL
jgi:hypothetical protein